MPGSVFTDEGTGQSDGGIGVKDLGAILASSHKPNLKVEAPLSSTKGPSYETISTDHPFANSTMANQHTRSSSGAAQAPVQVPYDSYLDRCNRIQSTLMGIEHLCSNIPNIPTVVAEQVRNNLILVDQEVFNSLQELTNENAQKDSTLGKLYNESYKVKCAFINENFKLKAELYEARNKAESTEKAFKDRLKTLEERIAELTTQLPETKNALDLEQSKSAKGPAHDSSHSGDYRRGTNSLGGRNNRRGTINRGGTVNRGDTNNRRVTNSTRDQTRTGYHPTSNTAAPGSSGIFTPTRDSTPAISAPVTHTASTASAVASASKGMFKNSSYVTSLLAAHSQSKRSDVISNDQRPSTSALPTNNSAVAQGAPLIGSGKKVKVIDPAIVAFGTVTGPGGQLVLDRTLTTATTGHDTIPTGHRETSQGAVADVSTQVQQFNFNSEGDLIKKTGLELPGKKGSGSLHSVEGQQAGQSSEQQRRGNLSVQNPLPVKMPLDKTPYKSVTEAMTLLLGWAHSWIGGHTDKFTKQRGEVLAHTMPPVWNILLQCICLEDRSIAHARASVLMEDESTRRFAVMRIIMEYIARNVWQPQACWGRIDVGHDMKFSALVARLSKHEDENRQATVNEMTALVRKTMALPEFMQVKDGRLDYHAATLCELLQPLMNVDTVGESVPRNRLKMVMSMAWDVYEAMNTSGVTYVAWFPSSALGFQDHNMNPVNTDIEPRVLRKNGIKVVLTATPILSLRDDRGPVSISDVLYKANVFVNLEEGHETAATFRNPHSRQATKERQDSMASEHR